MRIFSILAVLLVCAVAARAEDLSDGVRRARLVVGRHLSDVKLNSVYGTPAFDARGKRVGALFLNFCGNDAAGKPMLMSLTLTPAEGLEGEQDAPRPDNYGHHLKPDLILEAWIPAEEALVTALGQHAADHQPVAPISFACRAEKAHGIIQQIFYWERDGQIHDTVLDARYGTVLSVGHTPWPHRAEVAAQCR